MAKELTITDGHIGDGPHTKDGTCCIGKKATMTLSNTDTIEETEEGKKWKARSEAEREGKMRRLAEKEYKLKFRVLYVKRDNHDVFIVKEKIIQYEDEYKYNFDIRLFDEEEYTMIRLLKHKDWKLFDTEPYISSQINRRIIRRLDML